MFYTAATNSSRVDVLTERGGREKILEHALPKLQSRSTREDGMLYRGAGFLAVVGFGSNPTYPFSKLDRRRTGRLRKKDN
jgi:hypothetical protein